MFLYPITTVLLIATVFVQNRVANSRTLLYTYVYVPVRKESIVKYCSIQTNL